MSSIGLSETREGRELVPAFWPSPGWREGRSASRSRLGLSGCVSSTVAALRPRARGGDGGLRLALCAVGLWPADRASLRRNSSVLSETLANQILVCEK